MGAIKHIIDSGDMLTIAISGAFVVYLALLLALHGAAKKSGKGRAVWTAACFLPLLLSLIHIIVFVSGSAFIYVLPHYVSIYIPAVFAALLPLLGKKKMLFRAGGAVLIAAAVALNAFFAYSQKVANYSAQSLSDAYVSLCDYLEENYVLGEWKKADWGKLKSDGLALVREAEKTGDTEKYYEALSAIVNSFHDGHMGLGSYGTTVDYGIKKIMEFNDYGICLITLDSGETIVVNAAEGLEIKNGDVVTKWDGVPVAEAIESVCPPSAESVLANERVMKTFYLSGVGGDTVDVTYVNSAGEEKTVTLAKIEGAMPRALSTYGTFTRSRADEYETKMLTESIGYMRVTAEETNALADYLAYATGDHPVAREMFRADLRALREQGMTKLVIDIRNNGGGYDEVATALASLFTKEKVYAFSLGADGAPVADRYILPDGEFSDIEVLVLTSMRCASAGDGLALYLSRIDGVTVAGITDPAGINQVTGGYVYLPAGALVTFPTGLVLDADGNPNIDTDHTRQSRNPVDVRIPLDRDAALAVFGGEDYELAWAIDRLSAPNS